LGPKQNYGKNPFVRSRSREQLATLSAELPFTVKRPKSVFLGEFFRDMGGLQVGKGWNSEKLEKKHPAILEALD